MMRNFYFNFKVFLLVLIFQNVVYGSLGQQRREEAGRDDFYHDVFPDDFQWGFATSAYQIEGAWDEDSKGPNNWDHVTHNQPEFTIDSKTGDVSCDSYHKYKEHIQLIKNSGGDFYRFSLSWARILPDGTTNFVNQAGIDYYNNVIDELLANGITPFVTLFHWDLPQALIDNYGYWDNEIIAHHFANYSRIAFQNFGDRVKLWLTFNEPIVFCRHDFSFPNGFDIATSPYQCHHTVIKSHGLAYRIYQNEFKQEQQGQVGITLNAVWPEPKDGNNADDIAASHRFLNFKWGMFAYPLMYGEYPPIVRKNIDAKSLAEGRNESRLPHFDTQWTEIIKDSVDFWGLNHYTASYVTTNYNSVPGLYGDPDVIESKDPEWPQASLTWLYEVPYAFRRLLKWIAMEYKNMPLYVTENGYSDYERDGPSDPARINYHKTYINEMLKAVKIDGVNVKGYAAWSLLDNMEWKSGYTVRFGLYYVNFTDPNLTPVSKDSARYLTQVFKDNGFPASN